MLSRLNHLAARPIIWIIYLYQWTFSPDKSPLLAPWLRGRICAHEPHCSAYGIQVLRKYGLFPGIIYMVDRISSCTPSKHKKHDPATLRVVFASSAPIGVPFLEKIHSDSRYDLVGVVTNPDQPVGRGMKVRPNIIKKTAEKLTRNTPSSENKYHIILLHDLTGRPEKNFLPRLKNELEKKGYAVDIPLLPDPDNITIKNKINYLLNHYSFEANTIIIGHSLGSLVGMKTIERLKTPIKGFVSIAGMYDRRLTPQRQKARPEKYINYAKYKREYGPIQRNIESLKKNCQSFYVISDDQDDAVPQEHQLALQKMLNAGFTHGVAQRSHLCAKQEPLILKGIENFFESIDKESFISTPSSLRLNSKKYAHEAAQFQSWLQTKKPDILVVIAYGKIIPQHILDIPTIAPINVHGSLLPTYRGASPIQSVLLNDEKETGITIMRMDAGLDTGHILSKKSFPLTIHTTALDIIQIFQNIGPDLLADTIRDYAKDHIHEQPQDDTLATHTTKLSKSDGLIDPQKQSLYQINNIYRGCYLWPKAHFIRKQHEKDITVTITSLTLHDTLRHDHKNEPLRDEDHILNPAIIDLHIKPANSKKMSRGAFLAGYKTRK